MYIGLKACKPLEHGAVPPHGAGGNVSLLNWATESLESRRRKDECSSTKRNPKSRENDQPNWECLKLALSGSLEKRALSATSMQTTTWQLASSSPLGPPEIRLPFFPVVYFRGTLPTKIGARRALGHWTGEPSPKNPPFSLGFGFEVLGKVPPLRTTS